MITVNTNMSSIIAQNSLYKSTNKMNTALQRLSTGLRINSAKDDAAGSAISTKLEYKVSSYDVAKDNAQMGQSMLDTANSTLSKINSMLQRIRDLSEQASNGTYGDDERKAMQSEIDALTEEIYRIKNTTEFNGKKILGEEESPKTNKMTEDEAIAQGFTVVKNAKELYSAFHNADGTQKLDAKVALFADIDLNELGNLDGNGSNWEAIGTPGNSYKGTFNGNGYAISNLKINTKNGDYQGLFGHINGATIENINIKNGSIRGKADIGLLAGNAYYSNISNCHIYDSKIVAFSVTGGLFGCLVNSNLVNSSTNNTTIQDNNQSGSHELGGIIGRGYLVNSKIENVYSDTKFFAKNGGLFIGSIFSSNDKTELTNCTYKPDAKNTPAIGSGTKYDIKKVETNPFLPQKITINTNLQVGINSSKNSMISVDTGFSLGDFNVSVLSEFSARNSLDKIDAMMNKITDKLTDIGSTQNRLISTMEFQEVQRQAFTSANSLIKDADIALESANYIKNQILQSVTSSILATANQNPQIALQLI